jgi:glycosyltransferase involved in cell wall biosynthesis
VKIAVIMAAYNAAPFIGDALASLLQQRGDAGLDIIVVDDGSTDGTGGIVRGIAGQAPEVRLFEAEHRGISAARNRALDAVSPDTDLVSVLDADDLSPAGRFKRDMRHFDNGSDLEFHYGRMRLFRDVGADGLAPDPAGRFADLRAIQFGAALFRRSLVQRVGRFDESLEQGEDADYLFRLFHLQPRMMVVDDLCVYCRRHATNVTRNTESSMRSFARAVLRHARRQKDGGVQVPAGFFDARVLDGLEWW